MRLFTILGCAVLLSVATGAQAPPLNDVAAAQIMLDRAGFSPGEIDGRAGENLRRAVRAFQETNAIPVTGELDSATLAQLKDTGSQGPLIIYTISQADLDGPFTPTIPAELPDQAQLKALDHRTPLEAIAERFHVSPILLRRLNPRATFTRAGEDIQVPNVEVVEVPMPARQTARRGTAARGRRGGASPVGTAGTNTPPGVTIFVTAATSSLTVEDPTGKILFHAPVTSGSEHDPLPIGRWQVTAVQPMPAFNYNPDLFWDADPKHSKVRIPPGPNNPVGTVWIDITKEHYGLHGTPEPSRIGHTQSHGCVRLTNWDIQRVARWAVPGTPVIFR